MHSSRNGLLYGVCPGGKVCQGGCVSKGCVSNCVHVSRDVSRRGVCPGACVSGCVRLGVCV